MALGKLVILKHMKKIFLSLFLVVITFFINFSVVEAEGEFLTDSYVEYLVEETGNTKVTHTITLENVLPTIYAKSYSMTFDNMTAENITASQDGQDLELSDKKEGNQTTIQVNFPDAVVGKGNRRTFQVSFDVNNLVEKTGEVWEITIPKLTRPESYRSYSLAVSIPTSFGLEAYVSPDPASRSTTPGRHVLGFNKETLAGSGISLAFGEFQVFSFVINYHLENPLNKTSEVIIPLPPDTAFQKVFYTQINPQPKEISLDADGNWLAKYDLFSRQRLDILATGSVQIYSKERKFATPSANNLSLNLQPTEYWQVDDPEIIKIASTLVNAEDVYNYVVSNLSYNFERVKPNVQRLGAKAVLANPSEAICMEFTDLFITLARAKGIPAREINGYAYTENPNIQPLSLVADVLHAWPEYWSAKKNVWIPVDPTWGKTTGGLDFFTKFDLRHFTFVIHGEDSSKPYAPGSYKLGPNPQKDIFINFGKLPDERNSKVVLTIKKQLVIPFRKTVITVNAQNKGPIALYNLIPEVYFDENKSSLSEISFLAPFNSKEFDVEIPYSFLGVKTPEKITVKLEGETVSIPSFKKSIIVSSLVTLFVILVIITVLTLIYLKRDKISQRIKLTRDKIVKTKNAIILKISKRKP